MTAQHEMQKTQSTSHAAGGTLGAWHWMTGGIAVVEKTISLPSFEKCVRAIASTIIAERTSSEPSDANVDTVSAFLIATHSKMPDYIKVGFHALVLIFDGLPFLTTGKPFHQLDFVRREDRLHGWEQSHIGAKRSLIAFYRSMVLFRLFSETKGKRDHCIGACDLRI